LIIHSRLAPTLSKQGRDYHPSRLFHQQLHFLLYVAEGISSLNHCEKRTIPESNSTLQGKPNTHAWNTNRSFRSNRFPHIPGYGSGPPQATAGPYAHQLCRTYVCSATTKPVFLSAMQNVLPHVGACKHKIKVEWWRRVPFAGPFGY
jgi:hypothetical protein